MAFEYQSKEGKFENLAVISEKPPVTPFQALVASQTSSDAQKQEIKSHLQLGASWSQTASQVFKMMNCTINYCVIFCQVMKAK